MAPTVMQNSPNFFVVYLSQSITFGGGIIVILGMRGHLVGILASVGVRCVQVGCSMTTGPKNFRFRVPLVVRPDPTPQLPTHNLCEFILSPFIPTRWPVHTIPSAVG